MCYRKARQTSLLLGRLWWTATVGSSAKRELIRHLLQAMKTASHERAIFENPQALVDQLSCPQVDGHMLVNSLFFLCCHHSYLRAVKWWRIIWAVYVLVLSGVPCEAFCQDEPTAEQASPSKDDSRDAGCSPFCLCATCPGCTLPQPPQLIGGSVPTVPIVSAVLPSYQAPHTLDVPGRIWQPPRLG